MAGLSADTPIPQEIRLRPAAREVEFDYPGGACYALSFEFLRVMTPSAEARGHGPGQAVLQVGKQDVLIVQIEPVGNYAIRPVFSDGHNTGIYSWDLIDHLCKERDALWAAYLEALQQQGKSR